MLNSVARLKNFNLSISTFQNRFLKTGFTDPLSLARMGLCFPAQFDFAWNCYVRERMRWFIYQICDEHCGKTYVEFTVDMYGRCAKHKSDCNRGLSTHFTVGCPGDTDRDKSHLSVTLLDYMDATGEEEQGAQHGGVGCVCTL